VRDGAKICLKSCLCALDALKKAGVKMDLARRIAWTVALAAFLGGAATAQPSDAPGRAVAKKKKRAKEAETPAPTALPCTRAQWKDDPVCFGENDPATLPLPSAQSGVNGAKRSEDVSISPKVRVNQSAPEPVYLNNPSPRPSASELGGGVGLDFHF
jgi:hypothetical protein